MVDALRRTLRRALRRSGIDLPFAGMICHEQVRSVSVDARWRATVTVRHTLSFLRLPDEGDLWDDVPVDPDQPDADVHRSPDARELGQRDHGKATRVYWMPGERVVPYALYAHERRWSVPGWAGDGSVCTEIRCTARTGVLALEIAAPVTFGAAVAFRRPRWRRLRSERSLVRFALRELDAGTGDRPAIRDAGQRIEWKVVGPRRGERFICIAFSAEGLAAWRHRLEETSIASRMKRVVGSATST